MAFTDLSICNLAIGRVGGDRLDSMDEESPLGAFCQEQYPHKRDFILSKYRWTFANAVALLARVDPAGDPNAVRPMAHQYAKPADLVGAVHDWRETADPAQSRIRPYVMEVDGFFWSDTAPLFAEYTAKKPEGAWPPWFRQLVVTAFAADLADFCQQSTKARSLAAEAWGTPQENGEGGLFASGRSEDARLAPPRQLETGVDAGPLVQARWGGGSPFAGRSWEVQG